MTMFSRLLGSTSPSAPPAGPEAGVSAPDTASQRDSGVTALPFSEDLLSLALETHDSAEHRDAQKRLAELIEAGAAPIDDQAVWVRLASSSSSVKLRQVAAQHVEGEEALRTLIRVARDSDKNVYRIAKTKLDDIHAAAKRVEEQRVHMHSIAETIEKHSYKPFDTAFVATLEHLEGEWKALTVDIPEATDARVHAAIDRARESITNHIRAAGVQAARESAIANAEPLRQATLVDLQKILAAIYSATEFTAADATNANDRAAKLAARWQDTLQYKPATAEEKSGFERLVQAVRESSTASAEHGALQQQVDAAATTPGNRAYTQITRLSAHATLLTEVEAPAIVAQAESAAKAWNEQQAQQRASAADAERQLAQLIRRAHQALAAGQSRAALGIRRSIESKRSHLAHVPKHIAERLHQLDEKLQELQDWKSFAVTPKRSELIEQMQALIGIEEDPVRLADQIRQLQEEWKSLAKGSTDSEDDWTKFHEAAQAAYQPCRAHFEAQSKQREANLAKRKALVAHLKEYESSTDWANVEWKHVANAVRSARQEWRDSGPTDRGPTKALEKSFDALLAKVQGRLDAEYAANLERKQSLIKQAQQLANVADLAQAANDVKRLQNAWRDIGLTPHKEGQKLWDEFKLLCDAVFDKRRAQHSERVAGLKQTEGQAIALCEEAEELAKRSGAEIYTGAARLRELRDAFAAIEDLPRDSAQSIQRRFRKAVDQFERAMSQQRQREADAAWSNLFDASNRIRLHQLEGTDTVDAIRASLAEIKHWPKGGLQALERKLAQKPSDTGANEAALRVLTIRAEIASGQTTPESDQTQRRTMQLQALVNGTGRTSASPREQLEALAFEWIAVGPAPTALYDELLERFNRAWHAARH